MKRKLKMLVTGAAGFIGFHLTNRLCEEGHYVIGVDNLTYASNIKEIYKLKKNNNFKNRERLNNIFYGFHH